MVFACLRSIALVVIGLGLRIADATAPVIDSYTLPIKVYIKDAAIDDNECTSTPAASTATLTFAIAPVLPTGLVFDTDSGKISGTPSAVTAGKEYSITPTDSATSAGTVFKVYISVVAEGATSGAVPVAPAWTEGSPSYTVGATIVAAGPTTLAADSLYTVTPVLPAGLTIEVATGSIKGDDNTLVAQTATTHTVTATNSFGASATVALSITVAAADAEAEAESTPAPTPAPEAEAESTPATTAATTAAATTASGAASNDTNSTAVAVTSADGVAATTISATTVAMAICVAIFQ